MPVRGQPAAPGWACWATVDDAQAFRPVPAPTASGSARRRARPPWLSARVKAREFRVPIQRSSSESSRVAFETRGTGHEYLARANNIQSLRCKARPLRPRKRPQRSMISRTFRVYANNRWLPRPGPWPGPGGSCDESLQGFHWHPSPHWRAESSSICVSRGRRFRAL